MKQNIVILLLGGMIIWLSSCEQGRRNETNISQYASTESHNMGRNCMDCHRQGGDGAGWFVAAGTLYKPDLTTTNPGNTVYLYTGMNGTGNLVATLQVDQKGNFYTTESIDFGNGLYPLVKSTSNASQYMPTAITTGACNSCHGVSEAKLWNF